MQNRLWLAVGLFIAFQAGADPAMSTHEPYHSGVDLCSGPGNQIPTEDIGELGFFVDVPVSYSNPKAGTFKLYAWTMKPFNPALKSMVYFVGGPGDTSHSDAGRGISGSLSPAWNAIYFDQRGNTCSRPADKNLLLDPSFFSSENTARDGNEIRKHLGIAKWSVYGQSYGTVPATIAGSLFPDSTRSVTISGVLYDGDKSLWEAPHRRKILQAYFDSFPKETRDRILAYSRRPDLPPYWFSALVFSKMYDNFPLQEATTSLNSLFSEDESSITQTIGYYANPFSGLTSDIEFGFGAWVWAQLACKELSASSKYANFSDVFNSRNELVPAPLDAMGPACRQLWAGKDLARTYHANDYPISVPVTYIQGGLDGPTVIPEAREHWRSVPRALAQFLYVPSGGHGIVDSQSGDPEFVAVFESALSGELLPCSAVQSLNASGKLTYQLSVKFGDLNLSQCDGVEPIRDLAPPQF